MSEHTDTSKHRDGGERPDLRDLAFNSEGLIPAIVQEDSTGEVLMMAWMNRESLEKTLLSGCTHFWSRSRARLWQKGEESGNTQVVRSIAYDCDGDTLLIKVQQEGEGVACHTGERSCFFRSLT